MSGLVTGGPLGNYKTRSALGLTVKGAFCEKAPKLGLNLPVCSGTLLSFVMFPVYLTEVAPSQDSQIPARVKNGPEQFENGDNSALLVSF